MIIIALYRPEKPANTGNIMRTCMATNTKLVIIGPLSFSITDESLKRAGMDYIKETDFEIFPDYESYKKAYGHLTTYYVTRYSNKIYSEISYPDPSFDMVLMFGRESTGIPKEILKENPKFLIRIPMAINARSLNLSNAVAITLYEVLRQQKYPKLATHETIKGEDFIFKD